MKLCEKCKKSIANVHLTEIKSGKRAEKHLCEDCARSLNLPHKQTISINDILGALMEKSQKKGRRKKEACCPNCGMTFSEFKDKGRLGCPEDYVTFAEELDVLMQKVHGATKYVGKVPLGRRSKPIYQNELNRLKDRLKRVIKAEAYEEAARIRDRIIELESLIED